MVAWFMVHGWADIARAHKRERRGRGHRDLRLVHGFMVHGSWFHGWPSAADDWEGRAFTRRRPGAMRRKNLSPMYYLTRRAFCHQYWRYIFGIFSRTAVRNYHARSQLSVGKRGDGSWVMGAEGKVRGSWLTVDGLGNGVGLQTGGGAGKNADQRGCSGGWRVEG